MTRLSSQDVANIGGNWTDFDFLLSDLTGLSLIELAAKALDISSALAAKILSRELVAAIPDTSGDGAIEGFAQSLADIAEHLGSRAFLAPENASLKDVSALGATIAISASDDSFTATSLTTGFISENGSATGRGFAQALYHMSREDVAQRSVLVVGAGPVGLAAAKRLKKLGAYPVIFDLDSEKANKNAPKVGAVAWDPSLGAIPSDFTLIIEASTANFLWPIEAIAPGTLIAAPGMPSCFPSGLPSYLPSSLQSGLTSGLEYSLTSGLPSDSPSHLPPGLTSGLTSSLPHSPSSPLYTFPPERYLQWHDPLVTGTAVMLLEASLY